MTYSTARGSVTPQALYTAIQRLVGTDCPLRLAALAERDREDAAIAACRRSGDEALAAILAERAGREDVRAAVASWRSERAVLERANPGVLYGGTSTGPISDREALVAFGLGDWIAKQTADCRDAASAEEAAALAALAPHPTVFRDALRALDEASFAAYTAAQG